MTRNERIKFILDRKKIGYEKLAAILGVTKQAVGNRLNREKEIDDDAFIDAVVNVAEVDKEMILSGKGFKNYVFSAHLDESFNDNAQVVAIFHVEQELEEYKKAFNDQRDQKLRLEVELESVKKQLAAKDETIAAKNELIENLKTKVAEQLEDIKLLTSQIKDKL